jgi:GNAT superfamily N-acetyltransferase
MPVKKPHPEGATRDDNLVIRPVEPDDAAALRRILRHWLPDDSEDGTLSRVLSTQSDEIHVVAVLNGHVAGVMGLEFDNIRPPLFGPGEQPASLISAYIDPHRRGEGIGSALATWLEAIAVARGCSRLVVVSGARSRDVGYPFWIGRYGDVAYFDADAFGPGIECVAWTVPLPRGAPLDRPQQED